MLSEVRWDDATEREAAALDASSTDMHTVEVGRLASVGVMGLKEKLSTLVAASRGDSEARYLLAERVAARLHPDAVLSDHSRWWLRDEEFRAVYSRFHRPSFRRTMDRFYLLDQLAQFACDVPGDTAECGVFEGLGSSVICRRTQPGKTHHAFDSFEGLSTPLSIDGDYWSTGDLHATEAEFRSNLAEYDVVVHAGWIPDRFADVADLEFSLVHVDVDLHEPTLDSIEFFYPRMSERGVMVFDDYGFDTCPGARTAVDDFFASQPERVLHVPTGQGVVVKGLVPNLELRA